MPRQDSLESQLHDLVSLANQHGMYDAADFLKQELESKETKTQEVVFAGADIPYYNKVIESVTNHDGDEVCIVNVPYTACDVYNVLKFKKSGEVVIIGKELSYEYAAYFCYNE